MANEEAVAAGWASPLLRLIPGTCVIAFDTVIIVPSDIVEVYSGLC